MLQQNKSLPFMTSAKPSPWNALRALMPLLRLLTAWFFLPDKNVLPFGKNLPLVSSTTSLLLHSCLGIRSKRQMSDLFTAGLIQTLLRCVVPGRAGIASRGNQLLILTKPWVSQILLYPNQISKETKTLPFASIRKHLKKSH